MKKLLRILPSVMLLVGLASLVAGCKQGVGGRCEVADDCQDGLICSTGVDMVCETTDQLVADASQIGPDARPLPDAAFIPDAGPPIDAAPPIDAPLPDAPLADAPPVIDEDASSADAVPPDGDAGIQKPRR